MASEAEGAPAGTTGETTATRLRRLVGSPVVRIIAVAGLLTLVVRSVDSEAMRQAAAHARWSLILPALALMPLQVLGGAGLWHWLARSIDSGLRFSTSLRAYLGSTAVAVWTPARAGDFAARPALMPKGRRRSYAIAVALENLFRNPIPILVAAPAALSLEIPGAVPFAVLSIGVAVASAALCVFPMPLIGLARRFRLGDHASFVASIPASTRWSLFAGHGLRYALLSVQFVFIALAMAPEATLELLDLAAATTVVFAAKLMLPLLSFAELGIREGASIVAFGAVGMTPEAALQASLLLFGINVLLPAAAGAPVWLRPSRG